MSCELCGGAIEGVPFALSSLGPDPRVLEVCQSCAESDYFQFEHCGVEVEVWRDDYIQADPLELRQEIEEALVVLEESGWSCERLRLSARSGRPPSG